MSKQQERQVEAEARRIARELGLPESLWELFALDVYLQMTSAPAQSEDR